MNLGVTLKGAEKVFGPARPGPGTEENTLSAVRYAKGGATKFAGISGIQENAKFYIHFPTPVDWNLLETKKGIPDFVNDLRESGPQGEQGRETLVAKFLQEFEGLKARRRAKQEEAEKKAAASKRKEEAVSYRERLAPYLGEQEVTICIGSERLVLTAKITQDKKGKFKIVATL
jgi:hypothetical protein